MKDDERWLFHALPRDEAQRLALLPGGLDRAREAYTPPSLAGEGFVHCSFRAAIGESVRLYFPATPVVVLQIDARALGSSGVEVAATPRGPMPHVLGPVPRAAIVRAWEGAPPEEA